jgi:hypothetical protein
MIDSSNAPRATLKARLKAGIASAITASLLTLATLAPAAAGTVARVDIGLPDTTAFIFRGDVIQGDLARLQAETAKVPAGQRIVLMLESAGGDLREGLAIGRHVHASRITTIAIEGPGCHSACSYIFLAGRDHATGNPSRIMISGAKIGFHQNATAKLKPDDKISAAEAEARQTTVQNGIAYIDAYYRELGIDNEFLKLTLSAAANTMHLIREFEALRLGIFVMDPSSGRLITPESFKQQASAR